MDPVWIRLLNSDWHDYRGSGRSEDRLENQAWLRRFLSPWSRELRNTPVDEIRRALRELRSLLQRMVRSVVSKESVSKRDWMLLNDVLSEAPVVRQLERKTDDYELQLIPVERDLKNVLAEIAASFAEVFVSGDPTRIRICENADCRWIFYDKSKSRTRRWCDSVGCGNLMKVRRFRARQKKDKQG